MFANKQTQIIRQADQLIKKILQPCLSDIDINQFELNQDWFKLAGDKLSVTLPFVLPDSFHTNPEIQHFAEKSQLAIEVNSAIPSILGLQPDKVKNVIAVSSAKGGVGKSTVAVNLALTLQRLGAKVGILDADIYGPSIPTLLNAKDEHPSTPDDKNMHPVERFGLQSNSIGYLVDDESAAVWRGPMASKALQQLYNETLWTDLDYLIVDMPPGTGDIQITLAQQLPVVGAIVVTTPQELALNDAIKGVAMFQKVNVPVLGIVENMSYLACNNCAEKQYIFGKQGGKRIAEKYQLPLLGEIPLEPKLQNLNDTGKSLFDSDLTELQNLYKNLAVSVSFQVGVLPKAEQQIPIVSV